MGTEKYLILVIKLAPAAPAPPAGKEGASLVDNNAAVDEARTPAALDTQAAHNYLHPGVLKPTPGR